MSAYEEYDDDGESEGLELATPTTGGHGGKKCCRSGCDTGASGDKHSHNYFKQAAVIWGFWWTLATLCAFLVLSIILAQERSSGYFTVHYWLNGNDSVDGDTLRSPAVSLITAAIVGTLLTVCTIVLGWRAYNKIAREDLRNGEGPFGRMSAMARNYTVYEPIAIGDALAFVMAAQEGGLANLWVMVTGALLSLAGDTLLPMMRLEVTSGKLKGSSGVAMLSYLMCKMTPFTLVVASMAQFSIYNKFTAAIAVYYAIMGLRVVLSFWMFVWPSLVYTFGGGAHDDGWARFVVERSPTREERGRHTSQEKIDAHVQDAKAGWFKHIWWTQVVGTLICLILFILVTVGTQQTLGSGDSGGRHVFARITMISSTGPSGETVTQFDRTYPLGQFAIPLQFGLHTLLFFFLLMFPCWKGLRNGFQFYWQRGRDPFSEFGFGIADFFVVWTLLTVTGTTQAFELLINGMAILISRMMWSETRKDYSYHFSLMAFVVGMIPFIQAAVNVSLVTGRSNQQLWAVIVLFALYAIRDLVLYVILNHVGTHVGDLRGKLRVLKPHHLVISRFLFNVAIRIVATVVLYYTHALYDGWQIVNSL
jgi:hypothetical protein